MHDIEPFHQWRHLYKSEEDEKSSLYEKEYSEFYFQHRIYNYLIHPQWDSFGSETLYFKTLYADYRKKFVIIECLGEWNDTLHDDFFQFWDNFLYQYAEHRIKHFILIGEHILNFHVGDKSQYEEYFHGFQEYGISFSLLNLPSHTQRELENHHIDQYFHLAHMENWRIYLPKDLWVVVQRDIKPDTDRQIEDGR